MKQFTPLVKLNLLLLAIVFILDRISKIFFLNAHEGIWSGGIRLFKITLKMTVNPVFAFSIPAPAWLITGVILIVFVLLLNFWISEIKKSHAHSVWLAIVVGGALGNIIDRIFYGGVIDWIECECLAINWASFNVADLAIIAGVVGWFAYSFKYRRSERKELNK